MNSLLLGHADPASGVSVLWLASGGGIDRCAGAVSTSGDGYHHRPVHQGRKRSSRIGRQRRTPSLHFCMVWKGRNLICVGGSQNQKSASQRFATLRTGAKDEAARLFRFAARDCPKNFDEWPAANAELKALGVVR